MTVQSDSNSGNTERTHSKMTVAQKLAVTAGAITALAPAALEADVVIVDDRPVSSSAFEGQGTSFGWDVDGVGGDEFELFTRSSTFFFSNYFSSQSFTYSFNFYGILRFNSNAYYGGQLNGRGMVGPGGVRASALNHSFNVGPTLAAGYMWGATNVTSRSAVRFDSHSFRTFSTSTNFNGSAIGVDLVNFQQGTNYLGFRFDIGGQLHYGWAEIEIAGASLTINRWAYESDANTAIHLNSIPEPGSLAVLGLGAAGVLAMRRRRKESA